MQLAHAAVHGAAAAHVGSPRRPCYTCVPTLLPLNLLLQGAILDKEKEKFWNQYW